jgi:hypothetical protein
MGGSVTYYEQMERKFVPLSNSVDADNRLQLDMADISQPMQSIESMRERYKDDFEFED